MNEQTTAEMIDALYQMKEEKKILEAKIKEISTEYKKLEFILLAKLMADGVSLASSTKATAAISRSVVPHVVDWNATYKWIKDTDSLYVLQRKFSVTAFRELLNMGEEVPGVAAFTKSELSLNKATKK